MLKPAAGQGGAVHSGNELRPSFRLTQVRMLSIYLSVNRSEETLRHFTAERGPFAARQSAHSRPISFAVHFEVGHFRNDFALDSSATLFVVRNAKLAARKVVVELFT